MCESKQAIARLFVAFADALDSMDDREFDLLIQGEAKLRLDKKRKAPSKKAMSGPSLEESASNFAQKLIATESREEAEVFLASISQPRKKQLLLLLAKACNVNVASRDSIAMIERQLVENVVGAKLDSEAIQKVAF